MRNKDLQDLLAQYPDDIDVGTVALFGRNTINGAFVSGRKGSDWLALTEIPYIPPQRPLRTTETVELPESNEGHQSEPATQEEPN